MHKPFIKNLTVDEAAALFKSMGEAEYRGLQLFNWLYEFTVGSFSDMTTFSKKLRARLDDEFCLSSLTLAERKISAIDLTEKFLFKTHDGEYIESVLIKNDQSDEGRLTICISSQVGCAMGCRFCQTAKIGFRRNLETAEILDQVYEIRRITGLKNNNLVFMGMGEPFLNYDNVLRAADIMNYSFGFHISARKITISTCGIRDGIERYIRERRPYNLAISVNDTEPAKRKQAMPVENRYPLASIIALLENEVPASRNRITVEYVMRADNISPQDARNLKKMFRNIRIKLNLIPVNAGVHPFEAPTEEAIRSFVKELEIINVPLYIRKSSGSDIGGACGQLSGGYYNRDNDNVE